MVKAGDVVEDDAFFGEEEDVEGFTFLVHHDTLNDSSEEWQQAVIEALAVFAAEDVTINYSWDAVDDEK